MPRFYGLTNNDAHGRPAQEPRRDPRDHPLPVRQEHAARRLRRPARQERPRAGQGALPPEGLPGLPLAPAVRAGRASSSPTAATSTPPTSPTRPRPSTRRVPRVGPRVRQGRLRPEPLEHRGQVPVARPGVQVAGQLDQGPRDVPPQEPDAQPPALARRTRPTSPPGSSRSPASGRCTVDVPPVDSRRGQGRARRAGQALRHQGGLSRCGRQARSPSRSARSTSSSSKLSQRRQADVPRREDDQPARLLRLPHHPGLRERQADRHAAQRLGPQEPDEARLRPHRRVPRGPAGRRRRGARRHRPLLPGEARTSTPARASSTRSCTGRGATTTGRRTRTSRPGTTGCGCPSSPGPTTRRRSRR